MNCDQRRDLLLLYISDALEASEAEELREHLQTGCPACTGQLAEAEALVATSALALERIAPPPYLKARLMERIEAAEKSAASMKVIQHRQEDVQGDSLPIRLFRYLVPAAVAAGLAIIATHAFMNLRVTDLQQQATRLRNQNDLNSAILMSQEQQLKLLNATHASDTQVVDLLRSPDLKLVSLQPTALQPHAVANLLWDKKQKQWTMLTDGMTPAAAGQTYELWFVPVTGAPVEAGTFDVDASGKGKIQVDIPPNLGPLKLAAVTNEVTGGVPSPKGSFQATASLE